MTREETIKVLAILKAAYPASYKGMSRDEANGVVMVWATQFANIPANAIMIAVQKLIASSTFPPTINEVKSKLRGVYWEAWQAIAEHENGSNPMEGGRLEATRRIMEACRPCNDAGDNEPTLSELIGGVQKYISSGGGDDH